MRGPEEVAAVEALGAEGRNASEMRDLLRRLRPARGAVASAPHTVYVSRKADVARLDGFIGPKA